MKRLFYLALVSVLAVACGKSDDGPDKKGLLTGTRWKATAYLLNGVEAGLDECITDDIWRFRADGTCEDDEGATKCGPSDPQITEGTWSFKDGETQITIGIHGDEDDYEILELTATNLKLKLDGQQLEISFESVD
jgi:hypothetical protein